ncbi:MAG TPA: hypothetical protein VE862_10185 [Candidatus Acidoferrum sp.]|nr:hypothetical protein [Candidatus Acidoferrum sp.]
MATDTSKLSKRIDKLEKTLVLQSDLMEQLRDSFKHLTEVVQSQTHGSSPRPEVHSTAGASLIGVYEPPTNPWTIKTSEALSAAISALGQGVTNRITKASYQTYEPTLKALKSARQGLTATAVAKKTTRKRNTESTYLWRLYLAGLVDRKNQGNKAIYSLKDPAGITQTFGNKDVATKP